MKREQAVQADIRMFWDIKQLRQDKILKKRCKNKLNLSMKIKRTVGDKRLIGVIEKISTY